MRWRAVVVGLAILGPASSAIADPEIVVAPSTVDFGALLELGYQPVEIFNPGTSPLRVNDLVITGPNAASFAFFSVDPSCDYTSHCAVELLIEPGGSRRFDLSATAAPIGELAGTLEIASDAGAALVTLRGHAFDLPVLEVTPSPLEFPVAHEETGSSQLAFSLRNAGPSTAAALEYDFQLPRDFVIAQCPTGSCSGTLAPGETASFDATFYAPRVDHDYDEWLPIWTNVPGPEFLVRLVALTGFGWIELLPPVASIDLGAGPIGVELAPVTLRGRNGGNAPLRLYSMLGYCGGLVTIEGPTSGTFAPGEEITWRLRGVPETHGDNAGALSFDTDSSTFGSWVPLSCRGYGEGVVAFPDPLEFGAVRIGTRARRAYQLRNTGASSHDVTSVALTLADPHFTVQPRGDLPRTLAPGEALSIDITYAPDAVQRDTATVRNQGDASTGEWRMALSGEGVIDGVPLPVVEVSPWAVELGEVQVGQTVRVSEVVPGGIRVHNDDPYALVTLRDVALTGSPGFAVVPPARSDLGPGDSAMIEVTLTPSAAGLYRAALSVYIDDEPVARAVVELQAQAVAAPAPRPPHHGCASAAGPAPWGVVGLFWLLALRLRPRRARARAAGTTRR